MPASPPPPPAPVQAEAMASRPSAVEAMRAEEPRAEEPQRAPSVEPYTGKFKVVMDLIAAGGAKRAVAYALAWVEQAPGNVMALVALGAAYEAAGEARAAARAYGSLVDLFPSRADLRRFAGARLEHVGGGKGLPLAIDTFRKAVEQRPDHPSSHRLLAFALAKRGAHAEAFEAALAGATRDYPGGRFQGVDRVLREDAGLLGAALVRARPGERAAVEARLRRAGAELETAPSLRFVLNWETDANDVDFHVYDADGGHAFFQQRTLPDGGGELYADVTTGYGPECFTVRKPRGARSPWYKLQAHYYSRGPMGYGMGKLEIIDHDGKGGLRFDERPFVIMADDATVELGKVSSR
ncbi:MAG TPA: hypothetical protein VFS00_27870 [Polyangiaceae bacterium]|nr:hypothetical protein [Polyangiaceae bacterium]